jgi:hypothetical protein
VHAILLVSPRKRAAANRQQGSVLLKGLLLGTDGRALSPTHARKRGRLYRYYVAQRALKGEADDSIVRRISAAEIEGAVMAQLRAMLLQPEIVVGTWQAARRDMADLTEREVREALSQLTPLWGELFPAEQQRIVRLLVERVTVSHDGADITLRVEGPASPARDLSRRTAA